MKFARSTKTEVFWNGLRAGVLFLTALSSFSLVIALPLHAAEKGKLEKTKKPLGEKGRAHRDLSLPIDDAVKKTRDNYLPLILYYDGGQAYERQSGDLPSKWESWLETNRFQKSLRGFVLARVTDADLDKRYPPSEANKDAAPAPSLSEKLGLTRGDPAWILLDFRESPQQTFTEKLPSKSKLARYLKGFISHEKTRVEFARKVEKDLEASRYAHQVGKIRGAVQKVLGYDSPKLQKKMDPVLREKVKALRDEYHVLAKKILARGDRLDRRKKYVDAIGEYDKASHDYPFVDVIRRANYKRGEILRKARQGI